MKILVTGGAGFIGSHVVDALIERGHEVVVLDNLLTGKKENINQKAKFIKGDVASFQFSKDEKFNAIFHLAAQARIQPGIKNPLSYHKSNLTGTLQMLILARDQKAQFIFTSSSSIFGADAPLPFDEDTPKNPDSPYALQKLMAEMYCKLFYKLYSTQSVILRYFNVYGERQLEEGPYAAVVGIFLKQLKEGKPFTIVGNGEQRRDFTYVKDAVKATILTLGLEGFHVLNIGSNKNYSINQLANLISQKHPKMYLPPCLGEYPATLADNSRAKKLLGWQPQTSLKQWLKSL